MVYARGLAVSVWLGVLDTNGLLSLPVLDLWLFVRHLPVVGIRSLSVAAILNVLILRLVSLVTCIVVQTLFVKDD